MKFLVLGPLEVIAADGTVALPAAKHRTLLAALLVRANQVVTAEGLIDALWEGRPPASAAKTLQTYVSQLRRELEPGPPSDWRTLRTVEGGYRLHVDPDQLDADRFERLAGDGRRALHRAEPAAAAAWLREALALWRGPAYGELAGAPFARAEAARLEELRLAALEWRAEADLALGAHAELVGELEELAAREPFRERLWAHLMLALYRSGRQAEALRAYRQLRGNLATQLGIDPSPELRRLEERILRQDPSLDLAAPPDGARAARPRLPPAFAAPPKAPLVGRDAELDRLRRAWQESRVPGRRVMVISGEPGIGKSRLAAEFARLVLADGGEVLVGHADEEPVAPYQPFIEALGQYEGLAGAAARLPEAVRSRLAVLLPTAVPGAAPTRPEGGELDRFHLLAAVAALLAEMSRTSPLLLVLEDLHWADRATLAMLLHLARSPERTALLVLVTARATDPGVGGAWVNALDDLRRHRLADFVSVLALGDPAVAELITGYVGHRPPAKLAAAVGRATDRNPFFVEELLHHLVEVGTIEPHAGRWPAVAEVEDVDIPEGIRHVLTRRLARLSAPAAELLQMSSVLGREFEFTTLSCLTGWEEGLVIEAVEEALRAGVLSERGTSWVASYSFRHALVREVLYSGLSQPRRQSLHLRAAAAIQAAGPLDTAGVSAAALHLRLAGPLAGQAGVAELSLRASEAAAAVYAWDEAVAHLRAALQALDRTGAPPGERARLAERLGVLIHKAGADLQEGIGQLERALAFYEATGDRLAAARIHSRLGMHLTTYPAALNVAAGIAHYQAAEAGLARQPGTRQLCYLYIGMAMGAVFGVRTGQLDAASRRAMELAQALDDESLAGWACYQRAWWAFNRGRLKESQSLHERMYDTAVRLDDTGMGAWATFGRALFTGMYLADPLTARSWCARGLALPHLGAYPRQRDSLLDHLGQARGSSGELAEARRIAADLDPGTVLERMLLYWSGDWEQAEAAWLAARERDARSGDRLDGTLNAYWLGRVRRLLGRHDAAQSALAAGLTVTLQGPQLPAEVMFRAELALLAADGGRPEAGRAELARCQEIIGMGGDWRGAAGRVTVAAGMLAAAEGRPAEAAEAFAAAVRIFQAHACRWDEAEARCLWAKALPAEGGRQRDTAAALYRRIGASPRWMPGPADCGWLLSRHPAGILGTDQLTARSPLTPRPSPMRLRLIMALPLLAGRSGSGRIHGGSRWSGSARTRWLEAGMGSYEDTIAVLEAQLAAVERVFAGLSDDEWRLPTKLVPVDPDLPHWTVFELAGHFDIAIGLTRMLIAGRDASRPARDRTSFFINPRSETAPVVYDYAYTMVQGKTPADMPGVLHETFSATVAEARAVPAGTVGPGYFAPMRADEFVASRIVEAVVHGIDLTQALGRENIATAEGIAATAAILDDLLARRTVPGRPPELSDDLEWILAASGRAGSGDNRLPLIG